MSGLTRLRTSPWLRSGLAALAVAFGVYGLVEQHAGVGAALQRLAWYAVLGAVAAGAAGLGCMMLAWRSLLADLGSPLPARVAARVMFIGQLGKYVPGGVWAVAAQVELARDRGVPRQRTASATVAAMAVTLATGLIAAAVALPLTSAQAAWHYWWVLACAPLLLIALYPPLLGGAVDRALTLVRRPPLERRISMAGLARCVVWSLAGWACYGLHAWILVSDVTGRGIGVLPLSMGAYALAWSAGFVIVFFPGGLGPREVALVAALAPVLPRASALLLAVVSRLVMTVGDLGWAGTGFLLGCGQARSGREPSAREPSAREPSGQEPSGQPRSSQPRSGQGPAGAASESSALT